MTLAMFRQIVKRVRSNGERNTKGALARSREIQRCPSEFIRWFSRAHNKRLARSARNKASGGLAVTSVSERAWHGAAPRLARMFFRKRTYAQYTRIDAEQRHGGVERLGHDDRARKEAELCYIWSNNAAEASRTARHRQRNRDKIIWAMKRRNNRSIRRRRGDVHTATVTRGGEIRTLVANCAARLATPCDRRLRCPCRRTAQRHVATLSYHHVRTRGVVQDIRRHWNNDHIAMRRSRDCTCVRSRARVIMLRCAAAFARGRTDYYLEGCGAVSSSDRVRLNHHRSRATDIPRGHRAARARGTFAIRSLMNGQPLVKSLRPPRLYTWSPNPGGIPLHSGLGAACERAFAFPLARGNPFVPFWRSFLAGKRRSLRSASVTACDFNGS